jgi:hypothetical protein
MASKQSVVTGRYSIGLKSILLQRGESYEG